MTYLTQMNLPQMRTGVIHWKMESMMIMTKQTILILDEESDKLTLQQEHKMA